MAAQRKDDKKKKLGKKVIKIPPTDAAKKEYLKKLEQQESASEKPQQDSQTLTVLESDLSIENKEGENLVNTNEVSEEKTVATADSAQKSSMGSLVILGTIFLLIGAIIGVLLVASLQYFGQLQPPQAQQESPTPKTLPSAIPTPQPSYESYSIQILNGSGVSGQAQKTADLLEEQLGFLSNNIDIGNASKGAEETTIQLKSSVAEKVFDDIKDALSQFNVVLGDLLEEDSDYDIVVTLGTKQD